MTRRFQFSLARSLIGVGLLCAAIALGRWSIAHDNGLYSLSSAIAGTISLAASVGVIVRREASLVAGAVIGIAAIIFFMHAYIRAWVH